MICNGEKNSTDGQATDENIIRRMRFTCWITKAENTDWEYKIPVAFPRQQRVTRKPLCISLHLHFLSLLFQGQVFNIEQYKIWALLQYYAAYGGKSLPTFRENLSAPSSRVKKSNFSTLEDGTDRLFRNVGKELPLLSA